MTVPCCTSQAEAPSGTSPEASVLRTMRDGPSANGTLADRFDSVRAASVAFASGLSDADATVQSMPDASPIKWHLAHTTWFFETFLLGEYGALAGKRYRPYDPHFAFLFNSYYEAAGPRHPRPQRGLLTRPTLEEILRYRAHVDAAMHEFLLHADLPRDVFDLITLGLHHEEQHQELMHTDLLHLFAQNPLRPAHREIVREADRAPHPNIPLQWIELDGGQHRIGHAGEPFSFDCETPAHDVLLRPFVIASRVVTNGEWRDFIEDGGYRMAGLWLSDGWATVQRDGWGHPLYWELRNGEWQAMTLNGMQPVDDNAPVRHVSYFEADAFARWAGKRLPTEHEWEVAAQTHVARQNSPTQQHDQLHQLYGPVWQWTASPYVAYPGFRTAAGAVGEYNGKFMCGQFVLRGGSLATPAGHSRATYRNFFYPHQRWQFCGLRLAEDR